LTEKDGSSVTVGYKGCQKSGRGITKDSTGKTLFDCTFSRGNPYSGDNCLQTFNNGRYEGPMVNGKYEGKGTFYWNNSTKFVGDFVGGKGKGLAYRADGSSYRSAIDFS
jgi:hypothetical protein